MMAEYVDRISKGDIPPVITDEYKGDFNEIKNNLNQCIGAIKELITDTNTLVQAAVDGDLSARADDSKHQGDYRKIVKGINDLLEVIVQPISQVVEAVEQVQEASSQISSSSQGVAEGASEQASSLEEISSSLEEMTSMTKQNSENAVQARNMSQKARDGAETGTEAMTRMSEAIQKIKASSDETAKILKAIDDIAFQTNLLALNAAVEAARAGEAGRGFAVVAEEVRNLAQRSAEASRTTANMIEESVKNAENGVDISEDVAKALDGIKDLSSKVDNLIGEIAAASEEQAQGIDQINVAVGQMDQVTQQNASNAEESASAAEELASQAAQLNDMLSIFKIEKRKTKNSILSAKGLDEKTLNKLLAMAKSGHPDIRGHGATHGNGGGDKNGDKKKHLNLNIKHKQGSSNQNNGNEDKKHTISESHSKKAEERIPFDESDFKEF